MRPLHDYILVKPIKSTGIFNIENEETQVAEALSIREDIEIGNTLICTFIKEVEVKGVKYHFVKYEDAIAIA